ncbi:hypothetical protein IEQ34_014402 [Dendrobium chrysotoxum]|uniref:Scarecrow-like protein 6 n=1 Tax=Dendrobium chrysotoxum TaxID=161865 RepID=A0AAV7G2Z9_DENCH|nr:hypothetical protein IEQ34_014402 [Dendrobium chrysotoxum]
MQRQKMMTGRKFFAEEEDVSFLLPMKGVPFNLQYWNGALQIAESQQTGTVVEEKGSAFWVPAGHKRTKGGVLEPLSSLNQTRSPSSPSSTSTLTSLGGGSAGSIDTAGAAVVFNNVALKCPNSNFTSTAAANYLNDWMLSDSTASPGQEQTFLHLIMGDLEDKGLGLIDSVVGFAPISFASLASSDDLFQISCDSNRNNPSSLQRQPPCVKNPNFSPLATSVTSPPQISLPPPMFFQESMVEKSQLFGPNFFFHPYQPNEDSLNTGIFFPLPSCTPSQQPDQSLNFTQVHHFPYHQQQQQQVVVDMLFKAAELVESGNFVGAHVILARLNHHLPSRIGKPLLRSAFYFKGALQVLVNSVNPQATASSPLDVVLKLSAYKAFSEVSPIPQFICFTATQALIEELGAADCIHIIDFDISFGTQWSSFMQELAQRQSPRILLLKITAFVSPSAFHPLELHLIKENLCRFAADLNIPFEIRITNIEAFDPAEILILSAGTNEAIAVNLPVEAWQVPTFATLLGLVKQLLPKIVISVDHGFDRFGLPFSHHFLHALQSCVTVLDSIDAAGTNFDVISKIEKFVLQPKIENCIIRCHRATEKSLPWLTLFESAGFKPVQFSNFTEMQAECLLKRMQISGFSVEKRRASLHLLWQEGELASVSVWRS